MAKQYLKDIGKSINSDISLLNFVRYEKGKGIAKKEENFAGEVASLVN